MDKQEARSYLSVQRAGEGALDEAEFQEALQLARSDADLARWWNEEEELDRIIAAKLGSTHVPAMLDSRAFFSRDLEPKAIRSSWSRKVLLAAACLVALAALFGSWRGPFQPAASLADYRDEMVSFISIAPPLAMESSDLGELKKFLTKAEAPSEFALPEKLRGYATVGCRVLRFRGHDVSLICFRIGEGKIAHLFVIDLAALPRAGLDRSRDYAAEGEWMTASWEDGGKAYVFAVQGDRTRAEEFVADL